MRTMISGFSGWARMQDTQNESVKTVDMALTVVATLLAVVTWTALRG